MKIYDIYWCLGINENITISWSISCVASFIKNRNKLNEQKQKRDVYIMVYSVVPYHYKTLLFISRGESYHSRTSNLSRTSVGNKIVDHSDVVGAAPTVGQKPLQDETGKIYVLVSGASYIRGLTVGIYITTILYEESRFHHIGAWTQWPAFYDDVIKLLALCEGNQQVTSGFPYKGQWRGALMFYLICAWTNSWLNNREAVIWYAMALIMTSLYCADEILICKLCKENFQYFYPNFVDVCF